LAIGIISRSYYRFVLRTLKYDMNTTKKKELALVAEQRETCT
jgi:hypothetical protein